MRSIPSRSEDYAVSSGLRQRTGGRIILPESQPYVTPACQDVLMGRALSGVIRGVPHHELEGPTQCVSLMSRMA